ncbi:P-type ATPase, partial [Sphingomonas sp.]|uniref:P-type ATPase n=1 Tax=Sphingomonas sp. TaxID=28214 RepID=UPI002FCC8188
MARTTPDGLSSAEAEARLRQSGRNALPRPATISVFALFLRQFRSPLIYLLLIAAVVSFAVKEQLNAFFIMAVLLINALVGAFQERRAETSMAELQKLIRQVARARRDGHLVELDAADLVLGDVISLESGMSVPADARLLSSSGLSADESSLTGESMPAGKDAGQLVDSSAGLADR